MTDIGSIKPDKSEGNRLAAISIRAEEHFLKAAKDLVTDIAGLFDLPKEETRRLDTLLLEVCKNIIAFGYEGDNSQFIDIIIEKRHHSLVIAVEDRGLPFDYQRLESGQEQLLWLATLTRNDPQTAFLSPI